MAPRKKVACFVYAVKQGEKVVYIGKGTGRRAHVSARKFDGLPYILANFDCEDKAFAHERELIAIHNPPMNVCAGGNGGRSRPKHAVRLPAWWRKSIAEIERVGSRVYAARLLVARIDETNCEGLGVSKVDLFRLREVANGCGA